MKRWWQQFIVFSISFKILFIYLMIFRFQEIVWLMRIFFSFCNFLKIVMLATFCIALNLPISFHGLFLFLHKLEHNQGFLDRIMRLINSLSRSSPSSLVVTHCNIHIYQNIRIKSDVPRKAFFDNFRLFTGLRLAAQLRFVCQT